ncbi:MAG: ABC transporter permease [Firmicutes bacterium]|nr:ABC transporter permease [Bacillota bacterium]
MNWHALFDASLLFTILLKTTPILLAGLGGAFTQQADILNIGLEGMMLVGAFAAVSVGAATQSALLAVLAAVAAGLLFAALYGYVSLRLKADYIIVGIGINLLAQGVTVFLLNQLYHNEGNFSPEKFPQLWRLEWAPLARVPLVGPMLEGQSAIALLALLLVAAGHLLLYRTRVGVHIRAVGENPEAAAAAGIDPVRVKFLTVMISGLLTGLAGAQLSMATLDMFVRNMTNGRGFIAVAAETFGNATPLGTLVASLVFGAADAVSDRMQTGNLPPQFVLMVPYLVTLVALAVMMLRQQARRRTVREVNGEVNG